MHHKVCIAFNANVYVTSFVYLVVMALPNDEQQLKEKERTLELMKKEIQERMETLYQQKVNEFFRNAHKVNHLSQATQCSIETADHVTQVQEGIIFNELI